MDMKLKGKTAIVTGGARGIGRGIVLGLAREGANVVVDDIDLEEANIVAQEAQVLGCQSLAVGADVTSISEVNKMTKEALKRFGKIDILVNNAGVLYIESEPVSRQPKSFHELTAEECKKEMEVVFWGALNCSKAVIEPMINQKSGSIVNIASVAGIRGHAGSSIYSAGKAGIIAFTKSLAVELGHCGIRVNCVAPGAIYATRHARAEAMRDKDPEAYKIIQQQFERAKQLPVGRMGQPEDIANIVILLASDAASYVTGQTVAVDGGSGLI
jgi:NAD(P)-dependent dehydrogenase (short-subunit alcohol dehydrogenase family)